MGFYEQHNIPQALSWFDYCKNLVVPTATQERAKCLRVLAKCNASLSEIDTAQSLVEASLELDNTSIAALALNFEIELAKPNPTVTGTTIPHCQDDYSNTFAVLTERLDKLFSRLTSDYSDLLEACGSKAASVLSFLNFRFEFTHLVW